MGLGGSHTALDLDAQRMIPLSFEPTGSRGSHWLKKVARGREPKHTTTCEHPCTNRTKYKYANTNMRLPAFPLSSLSSLPTALHPIWQTENLNICTQRYINEAINIGHFHHFNLSSKTLTQKNLQILATLKFKKIILAEFFRLGKKSCKISSETSQFQENYMILGIPGTLFLYPNSKRGFFRVFLTVDPVTFPGLPLCRPWKVVIF